MVIYTSFEQYVQSATTIQAKLAKIDAIIDVLLTTALVSAGSDNTQEYSLDDGQSKVSTIYKGTDGVMKSIAAFEKLRDYYKTKLDNNTGRVVQLVDRRNFKGNGRI